MIERVRGPVVARRAGFAVIDVSGLGLEVQMTARAHGSLPAPGMEAVVLTRYIVREDGVALYGFADDAERDGFDRLLAVAGVGPKLALATVSALAPDRLRRALAEGETGVLTSVPGVGRRLADRMVLDLKDWASAFVLAAADGAPGPARAADLLEPGPAATAVDALVGLGYGASEARSAIAAARQDGVEGAEALVRDGLRRLGRAAVRTLEEPVGEG